MKSERNPNQKAFKIIKKSVTVSKPKSLHREPEMDPAKAVAFAKSIAQEMKMKQREADEAKRRESEVAAVDTHKRYTAAELRVFERELLAQRKRINEGLGNLRATASINAIDDIEPDGGDGTNQSMRLDALSHIENANKAIVDIDEALRRIDDGSYGVCITCGCLIAKPRLMHLPFAKTCTNCQRSFETAQRNAETAVSDDDDSSRL